MSPFDSVLSSHAVNFGKAFLRPRSCQLLAMFIYLFFISPKLFIWFFFLSALGMEHLFHHFSGAFPFVITKALGMVGLANILLAFLPILYLPNPSQFNLLVS